MTRLGVALIAVVVNGLLFVSPAQAEAPEWRSYPLGQRLTVGVAGFRPNIDTKISTTGPGNAIQGNIDFERDLGLEDSKTTTIGALRWRISKRNQLRFDYFNLDRSSQSSSEVSITIQPDSGPPVTFPVDTQLQSALDIEAYNLSYAFSILFDEKKDWSIGLGLSWQDIAASVTNPLDVTEFADIDVGAPLPTLNTTFSYAFSDKWLLDLGLGWLDVEFDLKDDGRFEGRIISLNADLRWQTWDHLGFVLGYRSFDVDVEAEDSDFNGDLEYDYRGPFLGVSAYF